MNTGKLWRLHPVHAWWSIMGLCMFSLLTRHLPLQIDLPSIPFPPFNLAERKRRIVELLMHGLAAKTK